MRLCMIRLCVMSIVLAALIVDARAYRCVFCLPGKYKSEIANNACLVCPTNTYVDYSGADNQNDCIVCPANSQALQGSSAITACQCNPGFFGPPGGPCTPCATGRYSNNVGQSACSFCPAYTNSPVQSDTLTDCTCIAGYTGADGVECTACALNTYKTTTGSAACTACDTNTMTTVTGGTSKDACVCSPGYTAGGASVNLLAPYSSTACARFITLTPKPSLASVATRNNVAIGSANLPTYNPLGGPNGNGHFEFGVNDGTGVEKYFDSIPFEAKISTKGFTIVAILKVDSIGTTRSFFSAFGPRNVVFMGLTSNQIEFTTGCDDGVNWNSITHYIPQSQIDLTQWVNIVMQYIPNSNRDRSVLKISINDATPITRTWEDDGTQNCVLDETFSTFRVGASAYYTFQKFDGKMAGFFFLDEVLSSSAITTIKNQMVGSTDLTTICGGASAGGCTGCSAGKYKVGSGPAACTDCGANKYSEVEAATAEATCTACPGVLGTSVSLAGNGALNGCKCNSGYTGPDGAACSACVAGSYKPATGSAACATCDTGKFSTAVARTDVATCQTCPSNSNTVGGGHDAAGDCTCNAGYTGADGTWCDPCVRGKFKSITGSSDCLSCAANKYSTVLGSVGGTCTDCPTNTNAPEASSSPAACTCNAGSWGGGGTIACTLCGAGKYKETTGPDHCDWCPPGTYSTVVGATAVSTCQQCPDNSFTGVAGSDEKNDCVCNPGYTGPNGGPCVACPAGKFKTTQGTAACTDCPLNTFGAAPGQASSGSCIPCVAVLNSPFTVTLSTGSNSTSQCLCALGYYKLVNTCTACGAGKYKDTTGFAACTDCGVNTYQPLTAQTSVSSCTACPSTFAVSPAGSSALASCQCAPGYFGPNGGTCTPCYAGRFKTDKGPHDCTLCLNGTYSTASAATSVSTCLTCHDNTVSFAGSSARTDCHCVAGYFTKDLGTQFASCLPCPGGTYNSILNSDACSKCTSGKYSVISKSTSIESCLLCQDGFSGEGFLQCDPCPLNATANPGSGLQTDCKCNPGFTGADGSTCVHCLPGKFKPSRGNSTCTDCPFDTYSPLTTRTKETDCLDCATNTEAPRGSDSKDDCKCSIGYTSTVLGVDGEVCTECSAGKFKDVIGHFACSLCPEDTYVDTLNSKSISDCKACFVNSTSQAGSVALDNCLCVGGFERAAS